MKNFFLCSFCFLLVSSAAADVARQHELGAASTNRIASNVAIVALEHRGDIYLGTAHGLSWSSDAGETWTTVDASSGLRHDDVSALYSDGSTLWLAANRDTLIGGSLYSWSEGLYYSSDHGTSWSQVNFGASGLNIPFIWGGDRTIFDIAGHIDEDFFSNYDVSQNTEWMFFSAFAGGLLASQDGGSSWRRIFPSVNDSIQFFSGGEPSYRNRIFSCVADTSHGDSMFVWAGSAAGVFQYVFVPPREKFYQKSVTDIVFCDTCTDSIGSAPLFFGGPEGTATGRVGGGPYYSRFRRDLFSSENVTSMYCLGGTLFLGLVDMDGFTTHLQKSDDNGRTFTSVVVPGLGLTPQEVRSDFEAMNGRLYLAAQESGLFVSPDTGITWASLPLDTFTAADVNITHSLFTMADTLLVGTDGGLLRLFLDPAGAVDSSRFDPFFETDSSSSRIICVEIQVFDDSLGVVDSLVTWTVHEPSTVSGTPMVGRQAVDGSWDYLQVGITSRDVGFIGDVAFVIGELGPRYTVDGTDPTDFFSIEQKDVFGNVLDHLDADTILTLETSGDTLVFGSTNGYAISINGGGRFGIKRPNLDTLRADFVLNHNFPSSLNFDDETYGLTGEFVPALGLHYQDTGAAYIWASGRPVEGGWDGRSYGKFTKPVIYKVIVVDTLTQLPDTLVYDTVGYGVRWQAVDTLNFAWNFAFSGDTVLSACDAGLLMDTGSFAIDSTINVPLVNDTVAGNLVDPGTSVYAAAIVDPYLWLGTDDGTLRFTLSSLTDGDLFARVDNTTPADEVYAYPVPFRPGRDQTVDFHFVLEQGDYVTVEVFDFAMNLVARPIDNLYYDAGTYPGDHIQGRRWDGRNGRGDVVAVGVYYFKVILGSGDVRWGKLAVIP